MEIECWTCRGFGLVIVRKESGYHVQKQCQQCHGTGVIQLPLSKEE
jgi:DnaJ-class molecular chaperone